MRPIELSDRLGRWSSGRGPLYVLLAARLRRLIDDGELPPGVLLPPDRALAAALAVGRTTVVAAYELLRSEDRITRRQGSGTRVSGTRRSTRSSWIRWSRGTTAYCLPSVPLPEIHRQSSPRRTRGSCRSSRTSPATSVTTPTVIRYCVMRSLLGTSIAA